MFRFSKSDSGQISILVLAISISLLALTYVIGMVGEVLIAQQRLNSKAEAIALAGAQELEFNQAQACAFAQEFSTINFGIKATCLAMSDSIEIFVSEPNPNRFLSVFSSNIQATSRAGIAGSD